MNSDALVNISFASLKPPYDGLQALAGQSQSQREPHAAPILSILSHNGADVRPHCGQNRHKAHTEYSQNHCEPSNCPNACTCVENLGTAPSALPEPVSAPLPLLVEECAFCGCLGTPRSCGPLNHVMIGGEDAMIHHACALWAPDVYQTDGSAEYLNLESEWLRSVGRRCKVCGDLGAQVTCTHRGCKAAYHLPCAAGATDVVLDTLAFQLWCPAHSVQDSEEEEVGASYGRYGAGKDKHDEDFAPSGSGRPRRHAALSRRHRFQRQVAPRPPAPAPVLELDDSITGFDKVQRPRTDWQRRGDVWVKVVPPWWCEQRTVHFANKVFRELFHSGTSAVLVDPEGGEWDCEVLAETRNDMRLQYTLRGQFQEYWESAGVKPGDILTFERNNPTYGKIRIASHSQGRGLEAALAKQGAAENAPAPVHGFAPASNKSLCSALPPPPPPPLAHVAAPQQAQHPSFGPLHVSHPNRWMELPGGSAVKTIYKSTLVHQQCPIAGWLFKKLYGRFPADLDQAPMHDPTLKTEFHFEVAFITAANVHYIAGREFGAWMRQASISAGDQIKVWREGGRVLICRVAVSNRSSSPRRQPNGAASFAPSPAAAWASSSTAAPFAEQMLSPPGAEALEALDALAAAARYAEQNGTPAIHAVLAHAAEIKLEEGAATGSATARKQTLEERLRAAGIPPPPSPFVKRKRTGSAGATAGGCNAKRVVPGGVVVSQQAQLQAVLLQLLRQAHGSAAPMPPYPQQQYQAAGQLVPHAVPHAPETTGVAAFAAIMQAFNCHQWSPAEAALLVQFRAKFALMDSVGREVALVSVMQLQNNKGALLEVVRGIVSPCSGVETTAAATPASVAPITTLANGPTENANRERSAPAVLEAPQAGELHSSELTLR